MGPIQSLNKKLHIKCQAYAKSSINGVKEKERNEKRREEKEKQQLLFPSWGHLCTMGAWEMVSDWDRCSRQSTKDISSYSWGTGLLMTNSSQRMRETSSCSQLVTSSLHYTQHFIHLSLERNALLMLSCHPLCLLPYVFHIVPNTAFKMQVVYVAPPSLSVQINPNSLLWIIRLFMIWSSPTSLA